MKSMIKHARCELARILAPIPIHFISTRDDASCDLFFDLKVPGEVGVIYDRDAYGEVFVYNQDGREFFNDCNDLKSVTAREKIIRWIQRVLSGEETECKSECAICLSTPPTAEWMPECPRCDCVLCLSCTLSICRLDYIAPCPVCQHSTLFEADTELLSDPEPSNLLLSREFFKQIGYTQMLTPMARK